MSILQAILAEKKKEVATLTAPLEVAPCGADLAEMLRRPAGEPIRVIGELKRASPSLGDIDPEADPTFIAESYKESGVNAMSVLTDVPFFSGSIIDLQIVSESGIPAIRKDFIFTKEQIAQARAAGAAGYLLMVSVIQCQFQTRNNQKEVREKLQELIEYGRSLGMEALVETHDAESIQIADAAGAKIIGVNSRSFAGERTEIQLERFATLLPQIPTGIVRVAESGITSPADIAAVGSHADAVLVGTALMSTPPEKRANFVTQLKEESCETK